MKKNKKIILTGVLAGIGLTAMAPFVVSASENNETSEVSIIQQQINQFKQQIRELIEQKMYNDFLPGLTNTQKVYLLSKLDDVTDYNSFVNLRKEVLKLSFESIQAYSNLVVFTFGGSEFSQNQNTFNTQTNDSISGEFNSYKLLQNPDYLSNQQYRMAFEGFKNKNEQLWNAFKNTQDLSTTEKISEFLNSAYENYETFKNAVLALETNDTQPTDPFKYLKLLFVNGSLYDQMINNFTIKNTNGYTLSGDPNVWQFNNSVNVSSGIIVAQLTLVIGMLENEQQLLDFYQTEASEEQLNLDPQPNDIATKFLFYFKQNVNVPDLNFYTRSRSLSSTNTTDNQVTFASTSLYNYFKSAYQPYYNYDINYSQSTNTQLSNIYNNSLVYLNQYFSYKVFINNYNFRPEYSAFAFNMYKTGLGLNKNQTFKIYTKTINSPTDVTGGKNNESAALINLSGSQGNIPLTRPKIWGNFASLYPRSQSDRNALINTLNGDQVYQQKIEQINTVKQQLQNIVEQNPNNPGLLKYYNDAINELEQSSQMVNSATLDKLINKATNYNNQVEEFKQIIELENEKSSNESNYNEALTDEQKREIESIKQTLVNGKIIENNPEIQSSLTAAIDNVKLLPEINAARQKAQSDIDQAKQKLQEYQNLLTPDQYNELNKQIQNLEATLQSNTFTPGTTDNSSLAGNINNGISALDQALEIAKRQNDAAAQELSDYKLQASSKIDELIQSVQTNPHSLLDESQKEEIIRELQQQKDAINSSQTLNSAQTTFNNSVVNANTSIANNTIDKLIQNVQANDDNKFSAEQVQQLLEELEAQKQKAQQAITDNSTNQTPETTLTQQISTIVDEANAAVAKVENKNTLEKVKQTLDSLNLPQANQDDFLTPEQQQDLRDIEQKISSGQNLSPEDENKLEVISKNVNEYAAITNAKKEIQTLLDAQRPLNDDYNSFLDPEQKEALSSALQEAENAITDNNFTQGQTSANQNALEALKRAKNSLNSAIETAKNIYEPALANLRDQVTSSINESLPQAIKNSLTTSVTQATNKQNLESLQQLANDLLTKQQSLESALEQGLQKYEAIKDNLDQSDPNALNNYISTLKQEISSYTGIPQEFQSFLDEKTTELQTKIKLAESQAAFNPANTLYEALKANDQLTQEQKNVVVTPDQVSKFEQAKELIQENTPLDSDQIQLLNTIKNNINEFNALQTPTKQIEDILKEQESLQDKYSQYLEAEDLQNYQNALQAAQQALSDNAFVNGNTGKNEESLENLSTAKTALEQAVQTAKQKYEAASQGQLSSTQRIITNSALPQSVKDDLTQQTQGELSKEQLQAIEQKVSNLSQKQSELNKALEVAKTKAQSLQNDLTETQLSALNDFINSTETQLSSFNQNATEYESLLENKTTDLANKIALADSQAAFNPANQAYNSLKQMQGVDTSAVVDSSQEQEFNTIKGLIESNQPISEQQKQLLTTIKNNVDEFTQLNTPTTQMQQAISEQESKLNEYAQYLSDSQMQTLKQALAAAKNALEENAFVNGNSKKNIESLGNLNQAQETLQDALDEAKSQYEKASGDQKAAVNEIINQSNLPESVKNALREEANTTNKETLESVKEQTNTLNSNLAALKDKINEDQNSFNSIANSLETPQKEAFTETIKQINNELQNFSGNPDQYQELLALKQKQLQNALDLAQDNALNNNTKKAIEKLKHLNLNDEQTNIVITLAQKQEFNEIQHKLKENQTLTKPQKDLLNEIQNNIQQYINIYNPTKAMNEAISAQEKLADDYSKYLNEEQQRNLNEALQAAKDALEANKFINNSDNNTSAATNLLQAQQTLEKALNDAKEIYDAQNQNQKDSVRSEIDSTLPTSVKNDLNAQIDSANTKDALDQISSLSQNLSAQQAKLNQDFTKAQEEFNQIKDSLSEAQKQRFNDFVTQTQQQLKDFSGSAQEYQSLLDTKINDLAKELSLAKSSAANNKVNEAIDSLDDLGIPQEEISKVVTPEQQQQLNTIKEKLASGSALDEEENHLLKTLQDNVEQFKNIDKTQNQINDAIAQQEKINEEYAKYLTPEQMQELNDALEVAKAAVQNNNFENANTTHNTEAANNLTQAQETLNEAIAKAQEIFNSKNQDQKDNAKAAIADDLPQSIKQALENDINGAPTKEQVEAIKQLAEQLSKDIEQAKENVNEALDDYSDIQNNLSIAQNAQIQQQINNAKNAINNYDGAPQDYPKFIEDTLKELNKNIEVAKINAQINEQKELAQDQVQAKEKIDQAIENTNNNDQLTPAQKQEIINNLTKAKDEIDSAQNADEINQAVEQALTKQNKDTAKAQVDNLIDKVNNNTNLSEQQKQNIVSDLQKQKDLIDNSEQSQIPSILDKAKVIENVDTQKALVDNEINNVQNNDLLTPAQKQELIDNLNTAKDQLQQALNSNQNPSADLAQSALDSTQTKVDEFKETNKGLNNTKADAKDQLNNLINSIQNNEELTPTQKAEIINKVNEALNNINNASEIPNVEQIATEAKNQANKALEADKSQNTELNSAKNSAKEEIQQLINNIQANEQLTSAQKQELANKLQEQINNLNNAENNTDVQNTLQQAKNLASEESQANIKLNNDKNQAQQQVNQLIESVKNNPNLSESQKHEIINELNNTKEQIQNAKDSDSINSSVEKAKAVENIETQKALVDNEIDKIQNNDLLTPAQKQELINALNNTKDKLDQALENNTSVEDNLTAQSLESAENKVQEFKETNKDLNENKANAKDQLNNLINSIQNNEELTPTQKADIINKIKEAINDINNSADIQNVAQITKDSAQSANNSVQNDKETNIPLNNAKEEAKAEIDKLLEQINNNPNLSEQQKQNLSTQAQEIKDTLNNQEIIPDVNRVVQEAKENLAKAQESDQALNSAREKFLDALDNIEQSINQQNDLTPNQKQSLSEVVNTEKAKVDQINNFSDVDVMVEAIKAKITSLIAQEIVKNRELNIEKANVDNKIEDIIKSISDNKYLNETQKQEIINNIKQKQQQAHESNTSEQLQQQLQNIYNYVNSNEVKGLEVNNAKDKLVNEINDLIEKEIKQNPNLSEEQKQQLEKQVNDLINQNIKDANSLSSLKEIQNKLEQEISQLLPQKSQTGSPSKVALIVGISIIAIALSLGTYGIYLLAKKRRK
ncbi:hypothetical protein V2E24_02995 [Mycoplasmopsis ciconiae]|uniref:ECM-binding protein homolog n=1 Tax=Mycoplasmopsis ciconiae TaxID=561067 RepID=A0ABU7MLX6_9BACT|nr:hypothetical protein [Mycoplasmopsis ciconiae]